MKRIEKAAVLGSGVMGATIAAHLANAGIRVLLLSSNTRVGMVSMCIGGGMGAAGIFERM